MTPRPSLFRKSGAYVSRALDTDIRSDITPRADPYLARHVELRLNDGTANAIAAAYAVLDALFDHTAPEAS